MSSKKEDLESYLKENALRKPGADPDREQLEQELKSKAAGRTSMAWFFGQMQQFLFYVAMFTCFLLMVVIYVMHNNFEATLDKKISVAIVITAVVFGGAFIALFTQYQSYSQWISGKRYKLVGWDKFVSGRSNNFWKSSYFITVKIEIHLQPGATGLERDAVTLFLKKWEESWDQGYSAVGYFQTGQGRPKDLHAIGATLSGDFGRHQLNMLVNKMSRKFIALADLLGNSLDHVSITPIGNERKFIYEKEKTDINTRAGS